MMFRERTLCMIDKNPDAISIASTSPLRRPFWLLCNRFLSATMGPNKVAPRRAAPSP
ncbi:hypothetical protein [Lysobacter gummosus]|uniref:hypothetical protein n=1 Tax=Lysobacter gummosus TaxID=262324 RepID=UPI0036330963